MNRTKTLLVGGVAALTLATAAGVAIAQQAGTDQERPNRMQRADTDNDGRISRAEFVDGRIGRLTALDANRDGSVSAEEMQGQREARRSEHADRRFARMDANGDGSVTRAEFDAAAEARPERGERAGRRHGPRGPHRAGGPHEARGEGRERGPIVIAEAQAKAEQGFARIDTDSDGYVTAEEQRAAHEARRETRRERMSERRAARPQPASPAMPTSE